MRPLNKWIERAHGLKSIPVNHYQPQDCEGSAPLNRLVVSEFLAVEAAQQFYDSAEYRPILKRGRGKSTSSSRPFGPESISMPHVRFAFSSSRGRYSCFRSTSPTP